MQNAGPIITNRRIAACVALATFLARAGHAQSSIDPSSQTGSAARATTPGPVSPAYTPLTNHDRLHRYLRSLVGPDAFVSAAFTAGINQWTNTPGEWGQGAEGFGRRFGSSFGFHVVRRSIAAGAGALLDEDNRYIPSNATGFLPRLGYALTSTVIARSHDGSRHISISAIGSYTGAAFISRTWQPSSNAGPQDAVSAMGISLGLAAGTNVIREFLPHVAHMWWFRKD